MPLHPPAPGAAPLRYGLIGPGKHAQENLLPALSGLAGARLAAVAARSLEAAASAARRWNAAGCTDDWRELAAHGEVDALIVAASPALHAEVVDHALAHGVSVFVEKPPAPDTEALEKLIVSERNAPAGTIAFVGFNFPYGNSYRALREAVGRHGCLRAVDVRMVSSKPTSPVWGCATVVQSLLQGLGTHVVDMALRELGPPDGVSAHRTVIDDRRCAIRILLSYSDGRTAALLIGNFSNRLEYRCEFVTDESAVGVLDQHNTLTLTRPSGTPGTGALDGKETLRHDWPSRRGGYGRTGYSTELASFHDSVVHGRSSTSPLSSCLDVYRVLDEVRRQVEERP
ncbi:MULTISPECIES: Gfo/Idh/MocA family oxidoreductase [unclassified Streptomyces]|uniref:Gfo/Idh/MocA family oxidoreductase n=1 Tax=unclassified Streptomyces TaxID=2593676 RepID=UPI002E1B1C0C|nr:Gfo/Idh/MocA family oxidoreductase [Streptomyces sp. NBC_01023]